MSAANSKRHAPFSLRLSPEERKALEHRAGAMPLGKYIKSQLFGECPTPSAFSQILAKLGQSQLSGSLKQIGQAAQMGTLDLTPETITAVHAACDDIRIMKGLLMKALGIRER